MKFRVRRAKIDPELRSTYEQYGVVGMQVVLGSTNYFRHKGNYANPIEHLVSLLPWLTEQFDRTERKETWSILMEVAIVILVAFEVLLAIHPIASHHSHQVVQGISQDVFTARPF